MPKSILCVGGAVVDRTYLCATEPSLGTSNPVTSRRSFGGVARNVAETLARLGARVQFISAIGTGGAGLDLAASLIAAGVDISGLLTVPDQPTAEYIAAFWQGELFAGFADMAIFDALTPQALAARLPAGLGQMLLFADCNLPAATLAMLTARAKSDGICLTLDAVSLAKSERPPTDLSAVSVLFLNTAQCRHLGGIQTVRARGPGAVVLTQGRDGVMLYQGAGSQHLPAPSVAVVNVSGAGDALIAGTLLGLAEDRPLVAAVALGLAAAALALQNIAAVPAGLSRAALDGEVARQSRP